MTHRRAALILLIVALAISTLTLIAAALHRDDDHTCETPAGYIYTCDS